MLLNPDVIKNVIFNVKEMNILDNYHKSLLSSAKLGFLNNCINGNLKVAKWLFSKGGVDHRVCNEYVFRLSCNNGHLKVAKWIFSLGGVNHHASNDAAFRWSCMGHLEAAQWIYSLCGVNYNSEDECAFKCVCEN